MTKYNPKYKGLNILRVTITDNNCKYKDAELEIDYQQQKGATGV